MRRRFITITYSRWWQPPPRIQTSSCKTFAKASHIRLPHNNEAHNTAMSIMLIKNGVSFHKSRRRHLDTCNIVGNKTLIRDHQCLPRHLRLDGSWKVTDGVICRNSKSLQIFINNLLDIRSGLQYDWSNTYTNTPTYILSLYHMHQPFSFNSCRLFPSTLSYK